MALPPGMVSLGKVDEKPTPPAGLVSLGEVSPPEWGEVLGGVVPRTGLSFIEAGAGWARSIGDALGIDSVSEWGADIARNARGASEMSMPAGPSLSQQVVSGGLESALQMAPALALAPASIPAAGIALAAGQQTGSRYSELRDAGFSGGIAGLHASIDGLAEALGEKIALPVLAQASRPFLNKLWAFMARDMAGEQLTTAIQSLNAALSDRPDMTWGEYLQAAKMTALVTPIAAGAQVGMQHGIQLARGAMGPGGGDGSPQVPGLPGSAPDPWVKALDGPMVGTSMPDPLGTISPIEPPPAPQEAPLPSDAILPEQADRTKLEGLTITMPVLVESTGEMQDIQLPATQALNTAEVEVAKWKQLLACVGGA